jgi:hypothetical protein
MRVYPNTFSSGLSWSRPLETAVAVPADDQSPVG